MIKTIKHKIFFLIFISALLVLSFSSWAIQGNEVTEETENETLNWLPYDQALTKSAVESIPILIYFYSDNCAWCRKLENETFTNKNIREIMNKYFSIVRINSKSNEFIIQNGEKITEKQLSEEVYQVRGNPTIWFLGPENERIASLPGFIEADVFIDVLQYIKDEHYKEYTFPEYREMLEN